MPKWLHDGIWWVGDQIKAGAKSAWQTQVNATWGQVNNGWPGQGVGSYAPGGGPSTSTILLVVVAVVAVALILRSSAK